MHEFRVRKVRLKIQAILIPLRKCVVSRKLSWSTSQDIRASNGDTMSFTACKVTSGQTVFVMKEKGGGGEGGYIESTALNRWAKCGVSGEQSPGPGCSKHR